MMKRTRFLIFVGLFLALLLGAGIGKWTRPENFQLLGTLEFDPKQIPTSEHKVGDFILKWNAENGGQVTIEHKNRPGFAVWQSIPGEAFLMGAVGKENVTENRGMFNMQDKISVTCTTQTVDRLRRVEDSFPEVYFFMIAGDLRCSDGTTTPYLIGLFTNTTDEDSSKQLLIGTVIDIENKVNRTILTFVSNPDEHFFGFGEQFTYFDMQGQKVPIWVSEQGVGRGEEPITTAADLTNGGAGGNAFTTYAPLPFYITNQMRSFDIIAIGSYPPFSTFDLRENDRVQVEVWTPRVYTMIRSISSPAELIKHHTNQNGRMDALPEWAYSAAIVGMQGGTDKVQSVYAELQARNTPITAFWLQDWVGQRTTSFGKQLWWNWEVDYDRYPGWDEMVADFKQQDIRVMVYASPYLADIGDLKPNLRRNLFQEAKENGYLVKNQAGEPYLVLNTDFHFGMVDFTNPDAWNWYKSVLKEQVVGSGASGWMADFGEGLPYDAVLFNQEYTQPGELHNMYPASWAKLNRQVVDETNQDLVFFNRAAFIRSPAYATLFWEGDQLVSWSEYDGIKSAVTGLNTSGLSGMAFNHSDIGGYTTITSPIKNYHRSRELLYRWMEMNAFTLIFRTHEGNQPDNNVQFYTDDESLDTFAYWAKVYAALFEYRKTLVQEAAETGLPVARHPFIHYPDDPETWKITYQEFMLGADFLIAPVTDEGATTVTAYLPQGRWIHLWTGAVYGSAEKGTYVTVDAPIGQPGVFYKEGSAWGENLAERLKLP
ncbi:MAG: alpha-glucosidase [Chloroflexi bacterium]|nr:alpha-glucosidase [Chloroflexota bacterium]